MLRNLRTNMIWGRKKEMGFGIFLKEYLSQNNSETKLEQLAI